uniref:Odorant-binding protein 8 n=1 Tax=Pyrrhalta aenescens TaxID=281545 RepID=A0A1J0KKM0_9CUCU|nr:odorant-binding protein 8 [Pyrrhalta aenescens]
MKVIVFCLMLFTFALANETKELIEGSLKSCGAEIDGPNAIRTLVVQENADEKKLGAILFCANKKIGLQYADGNINLDVLERLIEAGNNDEETAKKYMDCGRLKGENGEEKAFNFLKCHETI